MIYARVLSQRAALSAMADFSFSEDSELQRLNAQVVSEMSSMRDSF